MNGLNAYVGNSLQISGVEEFRIVGGKGDGMRLLTVRNGKGIEFTVSVDRCADISRLSFNGCNYGYFSPTGYVAPSYYDDKENGFIKSFTAGFLTTCGLNSVGTPCEDEGQKFPLHGNISNTPAEHIYWTEDENEINIHADIHSSVMFGDKLLQKRNICCSKLENKIEIKDTIKNLGDKKTACMILYHINIGYPLLSEKSILNIPSKNVLPRNAHAQSDIDKWNEILPPQKNWEEQCYYHSFDKNGYASIYNPEINKGLEISFDATKLNSFVEWKMMGYKDYVLGLEPGNCHPDGRDKMRNQGKLVFIDSEEAITYNVLLKCLEGSNNYVSNFKGNFTRG